MVRFGIVAQAHPEAPVFLVFTFAGLFRWLFDLFFSSSPQH
jgi:hypothetical protein